MYLSRTFETDIPGFEKVSHVLQPRIIYASSLYQSADPNHPFFYSNSQTGLANPRFDILDYPIPYEYTRLELINRFRRKTAKGIRAFFSPSALLSNTICCL